jgi:hypothetical protein
MKTSKTLSPKQKKIAQVAGDPNKIEGEDFKKLKTMKASEGTFAKRAKKLKEDVDSEFVERAGKLKMGKKMGGSAIKANEGVGIDKARKHKQFVKEKLDTAKGYAKEMLGISSKDDTAEKLGRAVGASGAGAGAGTGEASAATLKYFLDNSKRSTDRLTPRDYEKIKNIGENSRRRKLLNEGFSDAEISAMGKKAGGAAIKGKGAVARDRGMGLQDENISVGKGADYIKDLIS